MEENSRLPGSPDLAAAEVCRNELTRTNSDSSSVTVDISKNLIRSGNTNARPCMTWTNEKHNVYLASLEASFVKQLHHSLGLLSRSSEQNNCDPSASQQLPVSASYSSDQFTVFQDGFCQRMNFGENRPLPYTAASSHAVDGHLCRRHSKCSGKHIKKTSADLRKCSVFCNEGMISRGKRILSHQLSSLGRQCVCHKCQEDAVGNIAEVSDQNFVDEHPEEKLSGFSKAKRLKIEAADASPNDQIVPSSGNAF